MKRLNWRTTALLVLTLALPAAGAGPEHINIWVGARVMEVLPDGQVRINRGAADGVAIGETDVLFHPLRQRAGESHPSVDETHVLGRGTTTACDADSAVVSLGVTAEAIEVGAHARFLRPFDADLYEDPVLLSLIYDIELQALDGDRPIATLGTGAGPVWETNRARYLSRLVDELRGRAEVARVHFPAPIASGPYQGRRLHEVLTSVTAREVEAFLEFAVAFRATYMSRSWRFVNVWSTWATYGAPGDGGARLERRTWRDMRAASQALAAEDLASAEALLKQVVAVHPAHREAAGQLARIAQVRKVSVQLADDPGDTEARSFLAWSYYGLGADTAARREAERLLSTGYRPVETTQLRLGIATRQARWGDAEEILEQLRELSPDDPGLQRRAAHLRAARARAAEGRLAVARLAEAAADYAAAHREYAAAIETATRREVWTAAAEGQARTARRMALHAVVSRVIDRLPQDPEGAASLLPHVVEAGRSVGAPDALADALDQIASAASRAHQPDLRRRVLEQWRVALPESAGALRELARWALERGEADAALEPARGALQREPIPHHQKLLGEVLLQRGDLAEAERLARQAFAGDARDKSWLLARVLAARGAVAEAVDVARAAQQEAPTSRHGLLVLETSRLHQAASPGGSLPRARSFHRLGLGRLAVAEARRIARPSDRQAALWEVAENPDAGLSPHERAALADGLPAGSWRQERLRRRLGALAAYAQRPADSERALRAAEVLAQDGDVTHARAILARSPDGARRAEVLAVIERVEAAGRSESRARQQATVKRYAEAAALADEAAARLDQAGDLGRSAELAYWAVLLRSAAGQWEAALREADLRLERVRRFASPSARRWAERRHAQTRFQRGLATHWSPVPEAHAKECAAASDEPCALDAVIQRAYALIEEGQPDRAAEEARSARTLALQTGSPPLIRQAIEAQLAAALRASRLDQARELALELQGHSRAGPADPELEGVALSYLGIIGMHTGNAPDALESLEAAYALGQRTGRSRGRADARFLQAAVELLLTHEYEAGVAHLREALVIFSREEVTDRIAQTLTYLSEGFTSLGRLDEARDHLERALDIARGVDDPGLLSDIGIVGARIAMRSGRPADAIAAAQESIRQARRRDLRVHLWNAHYELCRGLEAAGRLPEALAACRDAVEVLLDLQSRSSEVTAEGALRFGRTRQAYERTLDLMLRLGQVDEAARLAERSNAATVRDLLDPDGINATSPGLRATLAALGEARRASAAAQRSRDTERARDPEQRDEQRLRQLSKLVAETDAKVKQILVQLQSHHLGLYMAMATDPISMVAERRQLQPDTAVVLFFSAGDSLYQFVVTRSQTQARAYKAAVGEQELATAIRRFRRAVDTRHPDAEQLGRQLYDWLLRPLEADLDRARTILIVPAGPLYLLPFHALVESPEGRPVRYAIERYRLGFVTRHTARHLRDMRRHERRTLLAFAGPDEALESARTEVRLLASHPGLESKVFVGPEALLPRVHELASRYHILHFATHGVLDPDPVSSRLDLADGPLTVNEISVLDLNDSPNLVVLSACTTAIGVSGGRRVGEGMSIAEAFASAGVPAIVASLWEVDDRATAELMSRFYGSLASPGHDTLGALREAQLALLRHEEDGERPFADPLFWSGFSLFGSYR